VTWKTALVVAGVLVFLVLASVGLGVVSSPKLLSGFSRVDAASLRSLEGTAVAAAEIPRALGAAAIGPSQSLSPVGLALAAAHVYNGEYLSGNPQAYGDFGYSIGISGTTMAVGAPGENVSGMYQAGNVYVFDLKTGALLKTLTSPTPQAGGIFGFSVAVYGHDVVAAAPGESAGSHLSAGHVYIFNAKTGSLVTTLSSPAPQYGGVFGYSVAAFGKTLAVGAPGENASGTYSAGNAYVFSGTSATPTAALHSPTPGYQGYFGFSVGVSKALIVVGAPYENVSSVAYAGHVYTFSAKTHALASTLASPNVETSGHFGRALAIGGNSLVVGASDETAGGLAGAGHAYMFAAKTGVLSFTLQSALPQLDGAFGACIAIGGTLLVVGAPGEAVNSLVSAGNAYTFSATTGVPSGSYSSPNPASYGIYGYALAVGKSVVAIGAPGDSAFHLPVAGQTYVY
jgi:FG-GAP repeat